MSEAKLFKKINNSYIEITKDQLIIELQEANKSLEKEIERLKIIEEKYKDSQLYIKDYKDEIERLNNIINELEKFLKISSEKDDYDLTEYNKGVNNAYNYTLDKLKELKENKDE